MTGESLARVEDAALLTGRGQFLDDLSPLPGALVAAVVRSPHAHARIGNVDLSRARNAPGVAAVIGPEEVRASVRPFPLSVRVPMPYYPSGTDKVRFVGEPVAVVVAADRYLAEDAAELVAVDYERAPRVTGTREALAPRRPAAAPMKPTGTSPPTGPSPSVTSRPAFGRGRPRADPRLLVPALLLDADGVLQRHRGLAGNGRRAGGHGVGELPRAVLMVPVVAGALGVPVSRFRLIVPPDIGGSFGIKAGIYPYVVLMALASRHAGRPVRWTEDRLEHLMASSAGADREMTFDRRRR